MSYTYTSLCSLSAPSLSMCTEITIITKKCNYHAQQFDLIVEVHTSASALYTNPNALINIASLVPVILYHL